MSAVTTSEGKAGEWIFSCPKCDSPSIGHGTQAGKFRCDDCGNEFNPQAIATCPRCDGREFSKASNWKCKACGTVFKGRDGIKFQCAVCGNTRLLIATPGMRCLDKACNQIYPRGTV
jgi:Zn finger protein HypA/HybF involved in hydrogenase expression